MVGPSPSIPILSRVEPLQLIVCAVSPAIFLPMSLQLSFAQPLPSIAPDKVPSFFPSASSMVLELHCHTPQPAALFCSGEAGSLLCCPAPVFPCSHNHFCILVGQADQNYQGKKRFSTAPGLAEVKYSSYKEMVLSTSMWMHLMARLLYDFMIFMASIT